jgi:hypothetical protein
MFAVIDLYRREAADELIAALCRALDRPRPLSGVPERPG